MLLGSACSRESLVKFKRSTDKVSKSVLTASNVVLLWLCHELEQLGSHADILELTDVWERYCTLAKEADIAIPSSFMSRWSTFKDKLAEHTHGVYEHIVLHDQACTESRTFGCDSISPRMRSETCTMERNESSV
jgi:hypothetical protein